VRPLIDLAADVAAQLTLPPAFPCGLSGKLFRSPLATALANDGLTRTGLEARLTRITDEPIEGVRRILAGLASID
jgi:hypothetical protein